MSYNLHNRVPTYLLLFCFLLCVLNSCKDPDFILEVNPYAGNYQGDCLVNTAGGPTFNDSENVTLTDSFAIGTVIGNPDQLLFRGLVTTLIEGSDPQSQTLVFELDDPAPDDIDRSEYVRLTFPAQTDSVIIYQVSQSYRNLFTRYECRCGLYQ